MLTPVHGCACIAGDTDRAIFRPVARPGRPPCRRGSWRRPGSAPAPPRRPAPRSAARCRTASARPAFSVRYVDARQIGRRLAERRANGPLELGFALRRRGLQRGGRPGFVRFGLGRRLGLRRLGLRRLRLRRLAPHGRSRLRRRRRLLLGGRRRRRRLGLGLDDARRRRRHLEARGIGGPSRLGVGAGGREASTNAQRHECTKAAAGASGRDDPARRAFVHSCIRASS